jgi:hypothetical protein
MDNVQNCDSYITGFMDVIHSPQFKVARKHIVPETGSVSVST